MSRTVHHLIHGLESLPHARLVVERFLDAESVSESARNEVVLVVNELVTNGFLHAQADDVRVAVTLDDANTSVEVVVGHAVHTPPDIPERPAPLPPPDVLTGRGLAIVDRLTARREQHVTDDRLVITCVVSLE